jgi:hypothetical protein
LNHGGTCGLFFLSRKSFWRFIGQRVGLVGSAGYPSVCMVANMKQSRLCISTNRAWRHGAMVSRWQTHMLRWTRTGLFVLCGTWWCQWLVWRGSSDRSRGWSTWCYPGA